MKKDMIKVGERIRLIKLQDDNSKKESIPEFALEKDLEFLPVKGNTVYYSRVMQIIDENKIKVVMPMKNGQFVVFGYLERYQIEFFTKKGIFRCEGKVVSRVKDTRLYYLVFELLTEFEKLQRREYYRLDCLLKIKFRRSIEVNPYKKDGNIEDEELSEEEKKLIENMELEEEEKKESKNQELGEEEKKESESEKEKNIWYTALMTNISGGGVKFTCTEKLNIGERIILIMHLTYEDGVKNFKISAETVSSRKINMRDDIVETRVKFVDISVRQREEIVRFVFDEERRIRKKKKGW